MDFDALMRDFAHESGMDEIDPDADGVYRIAADDMAIAVGILSESGALALWGDAGEPPPGEREAFYRMLLETAYAGSGTPEALFSLDRQTGRVLLHAGDASAPDTLDGLRDRLNAFADTLGVWRQRIADFRADENVHVADVGEGPIGFGQDAFIRI